MATAAPESAPSTPTPSPSPGKRFSVYQNAAVASALAARGPETTSSLTRGVVAFIFLLVSWLMLSYFYRKESIRQIMRLFGLSRLFAKTVAQICQGMFTLLFIASMLGLVKAIFSSNDETYFKVTSRSPLTPRQQSLIGRRSSILSPPTPTPKPSPSSPSPSKMVPVHPPLFKGPKGNQMPVAAAVAAAAASPATPVPLSSFPYTPPTSSNSSDRPWGLRLRKDEIRSERELESFLAEVEEKMESSGKPVSTFGTPQGPVAPSPIRVLTAAGVASPSVMTSSRSPANTPVRALRASPSSQKSSPQKAEGDLPAAFTIEQTIDGYRKLGVWPEIEQWRDRLRQWFSDALLVPLVDKIDKSHLQVMETAAKLGFQLVISPIGGKRSSSTTPVTADGTTQEWLTTFAPDEDALIHQFRAQLITAKNASSTPSIFGLKISSPEVNPVLQECLDAVTEHQRLRALVKGEWVKGLLPQSSVRSDYTVQRLRELAEGTCVKKYEFAGTGEVYDKATKKWTLELPTDAHLLVYLFCALLEHPQWMLHVDPRSHPSTQSGNNPLFIAALPQKERFPEKYVAVLSSAPPVLHAGACVLAVGKQSPPVFALYWDKRLQFSLQGRTALWDAILLLCYRLKVAHGGVVRGVNLGGSAFNLLQVLGERRAES